MFMALNPYQAPEDRGGVLEQENLSDGSRREFLRNESYIISIGLGFTVLGCWEIINYTSVYHSFILFSHYHIECWAMIFHIAGGLSILKFRIIGVFLAFISSIYFCFQPALAWQNYLTHPFPSDFYSFQSEGAVLIAGMMFVRMLYLVLSPSTYRLLSRRHRDQMVETAHLNRERPWRLDYVIWSGPAWYLLGFCAHWVRKWFI
jgi:hypothetical protein